MEERYSRNFPMIDEEEQAQLRKTHVLVVGCGGLGGYIIEFLARLGIGAITAVDGDKFNESNLNRQLLATVDNIGELKAEAARKRVASVNPDVRFTAINDYLTRDNSTKIISDVDIIVDALDNVAARLILEDAAEAARIPIVHGAIEGWDIQAMIIEPGSRLLHEIYSPKENYNRKCVLAFTPAVCAGVQVAALTRYICNNRSALDNTLYRGSLHSMESQTCKFK